ncbi:MAG: InlB B-repeat-containing protein [Clostridia bacterium]|nr:InlB B-repeat-containing protein [Clostridia bacterium]
MKRKFLFCLVAIICCFVSFGLVACGNNQDQKEPEVLYSVRFFDYDGTQLGVPTSESDPTMIYTQKVKHGQSATAPVVHEREGYEFRGWSKDYTNITTNIDIYAQYTQVFEVRFLDGETIYATAYVRYGQNAEVPATNPSRFGFRFDHWEGNYTNVTADTIVTAVFVKQFQVKFVDYDGTVISIQDVDINSSAAAPVVPTRDGYAFDHWDTDFLSVTEDLVVTAVYRDYFVVNFVDYNQTVLKTEKVVYGADATAPDMTSQGIYVDFNSTIKQGYQFKEWNGEYTHVDKDLTIKAVYEAVKTPIVYVKSETIKNGSSQFVNVSVYIVSGEEFAGLDLDLTYDTELQLDEKNISVKGIFNTQNRYSINLNTTSREVEFSWVYSSIDGCSLENNYSKVLELEFEVDDFISTGSHAVNVLSSSNYVQNGIKLTPLIISGAVVVEEV